MIVAFRTAANRIISKQCHFLGVISSPSCNFSKFGLNEERKKLLSEELSSVLGCNIATARAIVRRINQKFSLEADDFKETLVFCKNNIRLRDVIENPMIVTLSSKILHERSSCLAELGLRNVQAAHIVSFNYIMSQTPDQLKQFSGLEIPEDVSQVNLSHLGASEELQLAMRSKMLEGYSKNCTLSSIKAQLNAEFLAWKLNCSHEAVEKFMKKHLTLQSVSIEGLERTIDVLIKEYGLDQSKISHCLFILASSDRKLRNFLKKVPDILGIDIQVIIRKLPAVLGRSADTLKKIEEILSEFGATDEQVLACLKVLLMDPATLRNRLRGLHESEDFSLLKNNKDFLWLVINHKWINHRLKLLKSCGMPCSVSIFLLSPSNFKKRIKLSKGSTYGKDIVQYFTGIFQCSESSVRKHMRDYPNMCSVSILNAVRVIDFLLGRGVSKEQLWNGLGVVAYELDTVEKYFNKLPYYREFQPFAEWIGHFNLMHLLIYAIERNSSCTVTMVPKEELPEFGTEQPARVGELGSAGFPKSREFDCVSDDEEEVVQEDAGKDEFTESCDSLELEMFSDDDDIREEFALSDMYII